MDEALIAEKLRANIKREEERVEPPKKSPQEEFDASGLYASDIDAFELVHHFRLPRTTYNDRAVIDKLGEIFNLVADELGRKDPLSVRSHIRRIEQKLGTTYRDDEKISMIFQYLKLQRQKKKIEKELKLI